MTRRRFGRLGSRFGGYERQGRIRASGSQHTSTTRLDMTTAYDQLRSRLPLNPKTWLITGVAGFIGCNLLETLLKLDQVVVGLDNFATGHRHNLDQIQRAVTPAQWARFQFIEGDIRKLDDCRAACAGVDYVLHQAALGSVPRSIEDPIATNAANIDGFLNIMVAADGRGARCQSHSLRL